MNKERHEIKANILVIHCEALIFDLEGTPNAYAFPFLG